MPTESSHGVARQGKRTYYYYHPSSSSSPSDPPPAPAAATANPDKSTRSQPRQPAIVSSKHNHSSSASHRRNLDGPISKTFYAAPEPQSSSGSRRNSVSAAPSPSSKARPSSDLVVAERPKRSSTSGRRTAADSSHPDPARRSIVPSDRKSIERRPRQDSNPPSSPPAYATEVRQPKRDAKMSYNNAVLTLVPHATGDPFCAHALGKFYLPKTFTLGDRIELWRSDTLEGFMTTGEKICVWRAPPDTDHSQGVWAPELHDVGGRWYILYTAEDPKIGIDSHRMFVLGGPPSNVDPCVPHDAKEGTWEDLGHIGGMRTDQWAIDGTYFWADGGLYMAYSGSPLGIHPAQAKVQELFIVHMSSPTSADSPPYLISTPTEPYEYEGDRGVNEGPQWLAAPDGSWRGLVISVSGTWNQHYKMLPLTYRGGNPLDARSWHKWTRSLCQTAKGSRGPYGPGHGNFIDVDGQTMAIFHATDGPRDGFENRKARAQRVAWTSDGPYMGGHVGVVVPDMQAFRAGPSGGDARRAEKRSSRQKWDDFKAGYKHWTSGW